MSLCLEYIVFSIAEFNCFFEKWVIEENRRKTKFFERSFYVLTLIDGLPNGLCLVLIYSMTGAPKSFLEEKKREKARKTEREKQRKRGRDRRSKKDFVLSQTGQEEEDVADAAVTVVVVVVAVAAAVVPPQRL